VSTLFVTLPQLLAVESRTPSADAPLAASTHSPGAHSRTVLLAVDLNSTVLLANAPKLLTVVAVPPAALFVLLALLPAAPTKSAPA